MTTREFVDFLIMFAILILAFTGSFALALRMDRKLDAYEHTRTRYLQQTLYALWQSQTSSRVPSHRIVLKYLNSCYWSSKNDTLWHHTFHKLPCSLGLSVLSRQPIASHCDEADEQKWPEIQFIWQDLLSTHFSWCYGFWCFFSSITWFLVNMYLNESIMLLVLAIVTKNMPQNEWPRTRVD